MRRRFDHHLSEIRIVGCAGDDPTSVRGLCQKDVEIADTKACDGRKPGHQLAVGQHLEVLEVLREAFTPHRGDFIMCGGSRSNGGEEWAFEAHTVTPAATPTSATTSAIITGMRERRSLSSTGADALGADGLGGSDGGGKLGACGSSKSSS